MWRHNMQTEILKRDKNETLEIENNNNHNQQPKTTPAPPPPTITINSNEQQPSGYLLPRKTINNYNNSLDVWDVTIGLHS